MAISFTTINGQVFLGHSAFGNLRILDNNGYEYRTNGQKIDGFLNPGSIEDFEGSPNYTFNFNTENGVILSDIIGVTANSVQFVGLGDFSDWDASNILSAYNHLDIDIYDLNEVPFSCRDITFACVNQDSPLLEELLALSGTSVASFEYGINNAIPHSKGGELLCPGNNVSEGFVTLNQEDQQFSGFDEFPYFLGFIGLNNGNERGSMDSLWYLNTHLLDIM